MLWNHDRAKIQFENIIRNCWQKYVPTPGIEPGPPGWKPGILTTRPYGRTTLGPDVKTQPYGQRWETTKPCFDASAQACKGLVLTLPCTNSKTKQKCASAGNRTRIYCLEGNNANLYTTDASYWHFVRNDKNIWEIREFSQKPLICKCPTEPLQHPILT